MSNLVLLIMTDSWNSPNPTDYIASLPATLQEDVAISSSDMSHDRFSCTFLGCVFSKTSNPASIFSNGQTTQQQTTTAMSLFELHGDQHFTLRGRLIGGFQVSGKSSCPSCCSKQSQIPTSASVDDTGNGSAESKNRLGIHSHCLASVTPVSVEASSRPAHMLLHTRSTAAGGG